MKTTQTAEPLRLRARDIARQLGAMREGGSESDRAALRRELSQVEDALQKAPKRPAYVCAYGHTHNPDPCSCCTDG